jgi:hypothetical protein
MEKHISSGCTAFLHRCSVDHKSQFTYPGLERSMPRSIQASQDDGPAEAFLFAYFCPEGAPDGEQVRFAVSEPGDPLHYQPLNAGAPLLVSNVGERGVRDPFLVRSRLTGKFHLLATDLRAHGGDWERAVRHGSRSILVWDSADLVDWTGPRLIELMGPNAGNTWAPEAFFDAESGSYVVFWASSLYQDSGHADTSYHRMIYSTTRDFVTFSEPAVYLDRGHSVIDSTMIEHAGHIYRFTKDERERSGSGPHSKFIFQERGESALDPAYVPVREGIGGGAMEHGEGPIVLQAPDGAGWYLFLDEFGLRGYVAFHSSDIAAGTWEPVEDALLPPGARHGSVLPITLAERERLLDRYPAQELSHVLEMVPGANP